MGNLDIYNAEFVRFRLFKLALHVFHTSLRKNQKLLFFLLSIPLIFELKILLFKKVTLKPLRNHSNAKQR